MVYFEKESRSAITFLIWVMGMSSNSPSKEGAKLIGAALEG